MRKHSTGRMSGGEGFAVGLLINVSSVSDYYIASSSSFELQLVKGNFSSAWSIFYVKDLCRETNVLHFNELHPCKSGHLRCALFGEQLRMGQLVTVNEH